MRGLRNLSIRKMTAIRFELLLIVIKVSNCDWLVLNRILMLIKF